MVATVSRVSQYKTGPRLRSGQTFSCGDLGSLEIRHVGLFDVRCKLVSNGCHAMISKHYNDGGCATLSSSGVQFRSKSGQQYIYDIALPHDEYMVLFGKGHVVRAHVKDVHPWSDARFDLETKQCQ